MLKKHVARPGLCWEECIFTSSSKRGHASHTYALIILNVKIQTYAIWSTPKQKQKLRGWMNACTTNCTASPACIRWNLDTHPIKQLIYLWTFSKSNKCKWEGSHVADGCEFVPVGLCCVMPSFFNGAGGWKGLHLDFHGMTKASFIGPVKSHHSTRVLIGFRLRLGLSQSRQVLMGDALAHEAAPSFKESCIAAYRKQQPVFWAQRDSSSKIEISPI